MSRALFPCSRLTAELVTGALKIALVVAHIVKDTGSKESMKERISRRTFQEKTPSPAPLAHTSTHATITPRGTPSSELIGKERKKKANNVYPTKNKRDGGARNSKLKQHERTPQKKKKKKKNKTGRSFEIQRRANGNKQARRKAGRQALPFQKVVFSAQLTRTVAPLAEDERQSTRLFALALTRDDGE